MITPEEGVQERRERDASQAGAGHLMVDDESLTNQMHEGQSAHWLPLGDTQER